MDTTHVLHYVFIQTQCVGEWKRTLYAVWRATTILTVTSVWCILFKMVCPQRNNQLFCIRIYHQQFGLCLMVMDSLFLNLWTILLCTLTMKTVFLQTTKNSRHQLQGMQTTCQAKTPPIIRSQKASSVTSSGISNFQKLRQNFWHQSCNSGIYYTTKGNGVLPC